VNDKTTKSVSVKATAPERADGDSPTRVPAAFGGGVDGEIARIVEQAQASGLQLTGEGGLLPGMIKQAVEAALHAEMTDHLGYERHAAVGRGSGNSRNGSSSKTVQTTAGPVELEVPRDRNGEFEPVTVAKGARRLTDFDDMIISLYAKGLTTRDIAEHLRQTYGAGVSHETVANITDAINEEVKTWRSRPLDEVYPIVYIDAIRLRIRDGGAVRIKACHLAIGVDLEGRKRVLGMWIEATEGARFWTGVLTQLRNRGVRDVLIVCCDGLTGLPDAIAATWPKAIVQTCVVHLIRNSMRYASWKDRKSIAAALRPIYTAPTVEAAEQALEAFAASEAGRRCPAAVDAWRRAWPEFVPFLDFPLEIRRVVYTTNAIESYNYQLRKVTKTRGQFPNDDAAYKLLFLAISDIELRTTTRGGNKNKKLLQRGAASQHWTAALNHFAILYPGRLPEAI
jgi:putative transposase